MTLSRAIALQTQTRTYSPKSTLDIRPRDAQNPDVIHKDFREWRIRYACSVGNGRIIVTLIPKDSPTESPVIVPAIPSSTLYTPNIVKVAVLQRDPAQLACWQSDARASGG